MSKLRNFIQAHPRLAVLTGAGVSTSSGIPDYRDEQGEWKRARPVEFRPFMTDPKVRQRYWARSTVGWPIISRAQPNAAHRALARLEAEGFVQLLITQNVDGLHATAGSRNVIDLHGRLEVVRCMQCGHTLPRAEFQRQLLASNPGWAEIEGRVAPDGDVDIEGRDYSEFRRSRLPAMRRHPQARCRVLWRNRAARASRSRVRRRGESGRVARRRIVADGLFRLPLR